MILSILNQMKVALFHKLLICNPGGNISSFGSELLLKEKSKVTDLEAFCMNAISNTQCEKTTYHWVGIAKRQRIDLSKYFFSEYLYWNLDSRRNENAKIHQALPSPPPANSVPLATPLPQASIWSCRPLIEISHITKWKIRLLKNWTRLQFKEWWSI